MKIGLLHRHTWEEQERIIAAPIYIAGVKLETDSMTLKKLAMGITSIVLVCPSCGDLKTVEVLGVNPDVKVGMSIGPNKGIA